jgi:hypothetical protein
MFTRDYLKKPSFVQLNCAVRDALKQGSTFVQLTYGENQITLQRDAYGWHGQGWIGKTGGADIANKINRNQG